MRKRTLRALQIVAALTIAAWMTAGIAQASPGLVVQDLNHGVTAQDLANSLVGSGVTISNVTYTGPGVSAGSFSGGASSVGFDRGIVLGSGSVQTTASSDSCSKGVEGPNQCDFNTTNTGGAGDSDLTGLAGYQTWDATVLEFDFVPVASNVHFDYVFSSDEYNEYANTIFNDTFAFFVNGSNCALVPGTGEPVAVNTINMGNPGGDPTPHNPALYRNNDLSDGGGAIDTEMDGLTVVLSCDATVNPGVTNHMKLAIADGSDHILDSNVFIKGGSLTSGTAVDTSLSGNGQSGPVITVPAGTSVSDAATLSGPNSASASGTVGYAVYSDASCSTLYASGGTKTVTAGTTAPSDPVSFPQAGTYYWVASYSGDGLNNPSSSPCGSEVLTVTKPAAAHLSLSPKSATNPVDSPHTVTATVTDAAGNPVANVLVQFSVSGTDIRSGSCTTDSSGRCSFTYVVASMPGNDTIHAYADSNENGSQDASEPADDATKAIVLPASTAGCKVTYGGRITAANGDKATFGGNAQVPAKGQEQFVEHGPAASNEFHSIDVQAVVCTGSSATIFGRGSLNRGPAQIYRIDVKDLGEPGRTDTYRLRIGAYDTSERPLDKGGNIQIHL